MEALLRSLLDDLDAIRLDHREVNDSVVRERMRNAVHRSYVQRRADFVLAETFGMFSPAGDLRVRDALARFLAGAAVLADQPLTPEGRLAAFQTYAVRSGKGRVFDDYFGHTDDPTWVISPRSQRHDTPRTISEGETPAE